MVSGPKAYSVMRTNSGISSEIFKTNKAIKFAKQKHPIRQKKPFLEKQAFPPDQRSLTMMQVNK